MIVKAKAGDSLCSIAIRHGFLSCDSIRSLPKNIPLQPLDILEEGTEVETPEKDPGKEPAEALGRTLFQLVANPADVEIVQESATHADTSTLTDGDEVKITRPTQLAITNYVSDRCGIGSNAAGDKLPAATFFGRKSTASRDPDHFKIQVFEPGLPASTTKVQVTLNALRPGYFAVSFATPSGTTQTAHMHPTRFRRPTDPKRSLTVTCERIGSTDFFRSPYLRLVTYETSRAKRPDQCLLVSDYLDDASLKIHERVHTEILHQRIEATRKVGTCPHGICARSAILRLKHDVSLKLHIHLVSFDPAAETAMLNRLAEGSRIATYRHLRRIIAPAHVRPHIGSLEVRAAPGNMLFIDRQPTAPASATGPSSRTNRGRPARIAFVVEAGGHNHRVSFRPSAGTFVDLANEIKSKTLAKSALAGFNVTIKRVPGSHEIDMLFADAAGNPVRVTDARCSDTHAQLDAIGGQPWWLDATSSFKISAGFGSTPQQRALHWNFAETDGLNIYVAPAKNLADASAPAKTTIFGSAQLASDRTHTAAIGPCIFLSRFAVAVRTSTTDSAAPTVLAHEIGHVLMHAGHAQRPNKDVVPATPTGPICTELMNEATDLVDAHDAARHISDAPIETDYELIESGTIQTVNSPTNSPVTRLRNFGTRNRLLVVNDPVTVDPVAAPSISTNPNAA